MSFPTEAATENTAAAWQELDQAEAEFAEAGAQHSEAEVMGVDDVRAFWARLMARRAA